MKVLFVNNKILKYRNTKIPKILFSNMGNTQNTKNNHTINDLEKQMLFDFLSIKFHPTQKDRIQSHIWKNIESQAKNPEFNVFFTQHINDYNTLSLHEKEMALYFYWENKCLEYESQKKEFEKDNVIINIKD